MKWDAYQLDRARFLHWYSQTPLRITRISLVILAGFAAVLLGLGLLLQFSLVGAGVCLLLLAPGMAAGSLHLYLDYLRRHPSYQLTDRDRQRSILNACDFELALGLQKNRKERSWADLLVALAQEPELSSLLYRLDLVPEQLEQHFRSIPLPDDQLQPILMECQVAAQQAKKTDY
jgi:hypothetical protein